MAHLRGVHTLGCGRHGNAGAGAGAGGGSGLAVNVSAQCEYASGTADCQPGKRPTCVACTPSEAAEIAAPELGPAPGEEAAWLPPLPGRAPRIAASSRHAFSCVNQSERCSSLRAG